MTATEVLMAEKLWVATHYLIAAIEPDRAKGDDISIRASEDLAPLRSILAMLHRRYDHVSTEIGGIPPKKSRKRLD